jgi:hypothetical protein
LYLEEILTEQAIQEFQDLDERSGMDAMRPQIDTHAGKVQRSGQAANLFGLLEDHDRRCHSVSQLPGCSEACDTAPEDHNWMLGFRHLSFISSCLR